VVALNVMVILAPALTLVAVALLAREATGDPLAALVAGLLGAVTPFVVWMLPVLNLSATWIPPAILVLWWWLQPRRAWWLAAATLVFVGLSVFGSHEFAVMGMALIGMDTIARLVLAARLGLPPVWPRGTLVFFGVAGVLLGTLAGIALANPATRPDPAQAM